MKKNGKLKKFLLLKIIGGKFNIKLNNLVRIKIKNSIIFLNFIIFQKLLKILYTISQKAITLKKNKITIT